MPEAVRVASNGPIATVILHRPAVRNAVDPAAAAALAQACLTLDRDPAIRVIVLWGEGGTFCAGADLGAVSRGWGVPLIDGGTFRLPRLIGEGCALDLILTGRAVGASEALAMGLVNRVVPRGQSRTAAESLALEIASFPQGCLQADRASCRDQWDRGRAEALRNEFARGLEVLQSGESAAGAARFVSGAGRGGKKAD